MKQQEPARTEREERKPVSAQSQDQLSIDLVVTCARFVRATARLAPASDPAAVWRALAILDQYGAMRVSEFAEVDRCSQPTATMMLRRLEDNGSVHRMSDPSDGRAVLMSLTDQGRARLVVLRMKFAERLRPAMADLSDEDADALIRVLPVIRRLMTALD